MKDKEKQALIDWCEWRIARGSKVTMSEQTLKAAKITLAALTAQPVKLPDYTPEVYPNSALENQKIKSRNEAISDCADAIRAAGYEVQE